MEPNTGYSHKSEDEDRFSMMTDDILLSILGKVDITTAARTSILATRWRHLPWLLRELIIDVNDFLPVPRPNPIEVEHMAAAMVPVVEVVRSFLATNQNEATVRKLQLKIYLVSNYSIVIGPLVSQAVDSGSLKDLDLAIVDEKLPDECYDEEMLQQAQSVDAFFIAYPTLLHCLTRLSLYNICFAEWDMNHVLFDCCKQLQYLYLSNCDAGGQSAWKIHAPHSKLSVLELYFCCLGKLEVLCLPKLERLRWDCWICPYTPLSLYSVPSLKELDLICSATVGHRGLKLSEVLRDTTTIHSLTLNFHGEKLWIKPEGKQLCAAFGKLRKLSLHGIFVEFDLLWTIVLLEAAPTIEIFDIEIWEHPCIVDTEERRQTFGERRNPSWKGSEFKSHKKWLLKEVQVTGFSPMEKHMTFLKAVMERAPNLQNVVLKDYQTCDYCDKIGALPRAERLPAERVFPKDKNKQNLLVKHLIRGMSDCNAQITFGN